MLDGAELHDQHQVSMALNSAITAVPFGILKLPKMAEITPLMLAELRKS
jgi:hypothetical protein